ncbi:unnamed protein product [marine sediment metagenome]|uniref:Uncharacterized protein n=1 Tax=marine sediment metagenome TaxID=412755 RepID=X1FGH7_9ZZZZ
MTNGTTALISTVPTFQAVALTKGLAKFAKKKKKAPGDFAKAAAKTIVGTELIKLTARQVSLV